MKKSFADYKLYVFDLDGTLYDQPKLRKIMATRLLKYYLTHPFKVMDLLYIYKFRKIKDDWDKYKSDWEKNKANQDKLNKSSVTDDSYGLGSLDVRICEYMANGDDVLLNKLCQIISKWIYENPLTALYCTRDDKLIEIINELKANDKKVVIFSDYPVDDKLTALRLDVEKSYCATDDRIGEYKPSAKGLNVILNDYGIEREKVLVIGDRQEKDGLCAFNCGVDSLILARNIKDRNYDLLKI